MCTHYRLTMTKLSVHTERQGIKHCFVKFETSCYISHDTGASFVYVDRRQCMDFLAANAGLIKLSKCTLDVTGGTPHTIT